MYSRITFIYIVCEALPNLNCTVAPFVLFTNLEYEVSDKRKVAEATVTRRFLVH